MNSPLQYIEQIQEVNKQIGFPLAKLTSNERLSGFYVPVGLVKRTSPITPFFMDSKKESVRKGGYEGGSNSNAIPTPMHIFEGQYCGTVDDQIMHQMINAVTKKII